MAPVHKYLSYNVIPYVDGCIAQALLSGAVTTLDVIVQQSDPNVAFILSKGMKLPTKIKCIILFHSRILRL